MIMNKLETLVFSLATSKSKKITAEMINKAADDLNVDRKVAHRAWKNYSQLDVQNERFSRRFKDGKNVGKYKKTRNLWQRKNMVLNSRRVYFKTAAKVILEIKNTNAKVFEVLKKYNIGRDQYYGWLEDLTISGKLLGRKIFDWTQYPKKDVKEIIRFAKYPERFIEHSIMEIAKLDRLNTVLDEYLK
jgi:hypothetical protein